MDAGDGRVEAEFLDGLVDSNDSLVASLAYRQRGRIVIRGNLVQISQRIEHTPQPLCKPRSAFDTSLRPFHIAFRRRIRQDEPARDVRTELGDDRIRIDRVLLGFRHLLNRARRDQAAGGYLDPGIAFLRHFRWLQPLSGSGFVCLVRDHTLCEQAGEGLAARQVQQADVAHGAGKEAGIEQVQHRVLDAANILVDRQPVGAFFQIVRTGEAGIVPGGVNERVERVGFAARRLAAFRTVDMFPCRVPVQRIAGLSKVTSSGRRTGRSLSGTETIPQSSQWMTGIGQPQ